MRQSQLGLPEKIVTPVELKGRRFEIEIDEDVMDMLRKKARRTRIGAARLASRLLRKELTII